MKDDEVWKKNMNSYVELWPTLIPTMIFFLTSVVDEYSSKLITNMTLRNYLDAGGLIMVPGLRNLRDCVS